MSGIKQAIEKAVFVYENANVLNAEAIRIELKPVIQLLEKQLENEWVPASKMPPEKSGEYLCTIEWYGASTKESLERLDIEVEKRIELVYFNKKTERFNESDGLHNYNVIAWRPLSESWREPR